jgi:tRNA A-37 threonylcarbamoyl transferase component Bud32
MYSRSPHAAGEFQHIIATIVILGVGIVGAILWKPSLLSDSLPALGIVVGCMVVLLALGCRAKKLADYFICVSRDGIEFSKGWAPDLLHRLTRDWDDLYSLELIEIDAAANPDMIEKLRHLNQVIWYADGTLNTRQSLRFNFKSGGAANVWLSRFNRLQLKCLFLAIDTWIEPSRLSREVVRAKNMLLIECAGNGSYTDIWMQELEDKFSTTGFMPLNSGDCLQDGAYRITTELSTRGQSAVYLGSNRIGQAVVIKELVLPAVSAQAATDKQREMFRREVQLLIKVNHPKIARVLDSFMQNNRDYIVLEYRQGLSLSQKYRLGDRLVESEVVDVISQVLEIVKYLHGLEPPIVHRDLTPDNIILQKDGKVAIVDFGAANEFLGGVTSTLVGKQSYMPPEQIKGRACLQSDIYAIGATAYFLLTGEDPQALSESSPRSANDSVSQSMDEFVQACTRLDPLQRFESCAIALESLKGCVTHAQ